ncbi:MAG: nitrile hydratase subunit beta [Rhodospirillales bacterium]|nr:nitrile hydratase subunit beta [Rhodospirillales bacterium]
MNGAADMGGMMGFGPVVPDAETDPLFHAEWERRVFAMAIAMARTGAWNLDMSRFARESLPPAQYLSMTYFEIWFAALEKLLAERGLVRADEIAAGRALLPPGRVPRIGQPDEVAGILGKGKPGTVRDVEKPARYVVGERVRMRNMHPATHTRLPRYVRGRTGVIELNHGGHVFPDSNALGKGEAPQWLYTVRFAGPELWGAGTDPALSVSVDAWESYLEAAT